MSLRTTMKGWLPPYILRRIRRYSSKSIKFSGKVQSWTEAKKKTSGYADGSILERVAASTREVIQGRAVYERDGVTFSKPEYSFPMLAALLHAASANDGKLTVIDVGGALGSTYRQCRPFLNGLKSVRWQVVEQENYVELGVKEFSTEELSFHRKISETTATIPETQVLLLSSVLQYLDDPEQLLKDLNHLEITHLVVDRTPVASIAEPYLCIQSVPAHIYSASYPCWILPQEKITKDLSTAWEKMCEFTCLDGEWVTADGLEFEYRGYFFLKKSR